MLSPADTARAPATGVDRSRRSPIIGAWRGMLAIFDRQAAVVSGPFLALAAGAVFAFFTWTSSPGSVVHIELGDSGLVYYDFPDVIADLKVDTGPQRHVKLGIVVELPAELRPRLEAREPTVIDALNTYLREQRAESLNGAAGATRVRQALSAVVDQALAPGRAKAVLFREFIVN